ncbi:hypothetical protein D9M69_620490 [compost metagenome]
MQDGADQQSMAGFLPVVTPLERAFRVDQDVGDILDIAHLMVATTHFQQRVVARRCHIRGVEQQAVREARAPPRGQRPVLALDIVNDRRRRPGK